MAFSPRGLRPQLVPVDEEPRPSLRSTSKHHQRRGAFLKTGTRGIGLPSADQLAEAVPDLPPEEPILPRVHADHGNLTRPGQTIVEALKETTAAVADKLNKHYPGWTPARDLAAQVHQKKKLDQERREQGRGGDEVDEPPESRGSRTLPGLALLPPRLESSAGAEGRGSGGSLAPPRRSPGTTRPSSPAPEGIMKKKSSFNARSPSPNPDTEVDPREEELRKQMDQAGQPGSIFWSPKLLKSQIQDIVEQLHTAGMEELLGEQLEILTSVVGRNTGLAKSLSYQDQAAMEHHSTVKGIFENLDSRVQKSQQKTELSLQGCQATGKQMVAVINAAIVAREKVRQLLLSDADIVVTEEKKAALEERRRQGQELQSKKMAMAKQEEEDGIGGVKEPQAIADFRLRIEKKTRKQQKLKVEHDHVQLRLKSLEQALEVVERGQRPDKVHALDPLAMEMLEEAKGHARDHVIAPYLQDLKREHGLRTPALVEMPEELMAERESLEQQIAEVEAEIEKISELQTEQEGQRQAAATTLRSIEEESERTLASFCAKRRQSYLGIMQVEPPVAGPMPDFEVERAEDIKAGLRRKCREAHSEMATLLDRLPKFLVLVQNAHETAKALGEQRQKFIEHVKNLKPKFLRDLRLGGAKQGLKDVETRLDEEVLMKEVEDKWDKEEARLCAGHLALQKRAQFFETISAEVTEEISRLQESIERSREALEEKMAPSQEEHAVAEFAEQAEVDDQEVARFLAFQETETDLVANALAAFREHDEAVIRRFSIEGGQAEREVNQEILEEMETKKVLRDVRLSELKQRRNSMVARQALSGPPQRVDSVSLDVDGEATPPSHSSRGSSKEPAQLPDAEAARSKGLHEPPALDRQDSKPRNAQGKVLSSTGLSLAVGKTLSGSPRVGRRLSSRASDSDYDEDRGSHVDGSSASPGASPAASTSVSRAASPSPTSAARSPRKRGTQAKTKKQAKKRPAKKAITAAARVLQGSRDFNLDPDEDEPEVDDPQDDTFDSLNATLDQPHSRRASAESVVSMTGDQSESGEGLPDQLRRFLKLDRASQRLEEKVRSGAERLAMLRSELVGEDASPLELGKLKNLAGDERAKTLAEDSVAELRRKWQTILSRRTAVVPKVTEPADQAAVPPADRSRTEEDAFQETYAMLLSQMHGVRAGEAPDAAS